MTTIFFGSGPQKFVVWEVRGSEKLGSANSSLCQIPKNYNILLQKWFFPYNFSLFSTKKWGTFPNVAAMWSSAQLSQLQMLDKTGAAWYNSIVEWEIYSPMSAKTLKKSTI